MDEVLLTVLRVILLFVITEILDTMLYNFSKIAWLIFNPITGTLLCVAKIANDGLDISIVLNSIITVLIIASACEDLILVIYSSTKLVPLFVWILIISSNGLSCNNSTDVMKSLKRIGWLIIECCRMFARVVLIMTTTNIPTPDPRQQAWL